MNRKCVTLKKIEYVLPENYLCYEHPHQTRPKGLVFLFRMNTTLKRLRGSSYGFKVSAAASVGVSVLRTEVSTGHPHPVSHTKKAQESMFLSLFSIYEG